MVIFIFIFIMFLSIFQDIEAVDSNCPAIKCSHDGPDILFPFSVQGLQPQDCSYPGFKLACRANKTIIQFPTYGDLVVVSISYDLKKLSLLDPKSCVHGVFLNLNLSRTPFHYYYFVKSYTYLNCSAQLSSPFVQVPCLSRSSYHVYVVDSFRAVPDSCKLVKTIAIPFSYSPYLSDSSFGLGFTWDLTGFGDFKVKRGCLGSWLVRRYFVAPHGKVLCIFIFILLLVTLISVKTYCSKSAWLEKLCVYCETLKHAKFLGADAKKARSFGPKLHSKTALGYGDYGSDAFKGMPPNEICA